MRRNGWLAALLLFVLILAACHHEKRQADNKTLTDIRIGYQKGGTILPLALCKMLENKST